MCVMISMVRGSEPASSSPPTGISGWTGGRPSALRSRREDILELANYFLSRHRAVRRLEFTPGAADALLLYDWPGNVRELERAIEGIVALAHDDAIDLDDLPPAIRGEYVDILLPSLTRGETLRAWGSRYARLVLERTKQAAGVSQAGHQLPHPSGIPALSAGPTGHVVSRRA